MARAAEASGPVYRPRDPTASPLWKLLDDHYASFRSHYRSRPLPFEPRSPIRHRPPNGRQACLLRSWTPPKCWGRESTPAADSIFVNSLTPSRESFL